MKAATITIEGKTIGFVAKESAPQDCAGCRFADEKHYICQAAGIAAINAGQPDCEDRAPSGNTYIFVEADARQLPLIDGGS